MEQTDLIRRARYGPNTILAAGMSRALNTALNSAESELLLLVLILDRDSGRILDAECNIILGINSDYIASLLVGRNFYQELDEIILSIQQQYFGPGQRALIVCLKDAYSKMRARSPCSRSTVVFYQSDRARGRRPYFRSGRERGLRALILEYASFRQTISAR